MNLALNLKTESASERNYDRTRAKIHTLERNIKALFASELDEAHKRMVLSVLWDYKNDLLQKLRALENNRHEPHCK